MINKLINLFKTIAATVVICAVAFTIFYATYILIFLTIIFIIFTFIRLYNNRHKILEWLDEE